MRPNWRQMEMLNPAGQAQAWRECAWGELHALLVEYADIVGRKQVAAALGVEDGRLNNALNGTNGNAFRAEWIPVFLRIAPDARASRLLARLCGYELVPAKELTAEQKLERLERLVREELPKRADDILEQAYGEED